MSQEETLDLLGKPIPAGKAVGRDAVHIAVIPVTCGAMALTVGDHVWVAPDGTAWPHLAHAGQGTDKTVGIVDPFLESAVIEGDRFFVYLYPKTITGLRHVWTHPRLPDEAVPAAFVAQTPKAAPVAAHWYKDNVEGDSR